MPLVNMWAVAAAENYMQIHTAAAGCKDDQNKVPAVHMAGAVHKVVHVHKGLAGHTGHNPPGADHRYT